MPYLPPEWVLIAGDKPFTTRAEVAVHTDDDTLTVRVAGDIATLRAYVAKRPPTVALVDLDADFGCVAVPELAALDIPVVALSNRLDLLDSVRESVSTFVQKPFSNKGLQKVVNGMVGRR